MAHNSVISLIAVTISVTQGEHKHVLTILRKRVMSQLSGDSSNNIGLVSSRAVNDLVFAHCFVTNEPVDKISISSKTSTNAYVFPLYFTGGGVIGRGRHPNLSRSFVSLLATRLRLSQTSGSGIPGGLTPEDILYYTYGVLYSPGYRNRYAEFLKIDFPRLPLTGDLELFNRLAGLGGELVRLHLLESPKRDDHITSPVGSGDFQVEEVSYSDETVWIDRAKTRGFRGVPEEVWNFHIGGYQVCEKWLKDRQAKGGKNPRPGRVLTDEDIAHYQKIVVVSCHGFQAETFRPILFGG